METDDDSDYSTPEGDEYTFPVREIAPSELTKSGNNPPIPPRANKNVSGAPDDDEHNRYIQKNPDPKPLLVRIVDELSTFESKTLFFQQFSVGISIASLILMFVSLVVTVAALAAAYEAAKAAFGQLDQMQKQTEIAGANTIEAGLDSAVASIATAKQIEILQRQLIQQRTALQTDQRPWIKFELGGKTPEGIDPNNAKERIFAFGVGQSLSVPMRITNIGKTAAERLRSTVVIEIVQEGKQPELPKEQINFYLDGYPIPKGSHTFATEGKEEGILYPGEVSEDSYSRLRRAKDGRPEADPLTQPEFDALIKHSSYILVFGEVWYQDTFGVHHWTKFCETTRKVMNDTSGEKCVHFAAVDHNQ